MPESSFDRQAFVTQKDRQQRPSSPPWGIVVFVVGISVVGFLGYKYVQANGVPELALGNPELAQISQQLEAIEQRLDRVEKTWKRSTSSRSGSPLKAKGASKNVPPTTPVTPVKSPPPQPLGSPEASQPAAEPSAPDPLNGRPLPDTQIDISSLRQDVVANQEAWEATTDRLIDTVGEVDWQRQQLNLLMNQSQRRYLPFDLHKRMKRHQVGPVWISLRKTDGKKQRYTLRLLVNDKWVEVKNRVLHEAFEFHLSGYSGPVELVVSEIRENQVKGYITLPGKS